MNIIIDDELKALMWPLSAEENAALESSIRERGCRHPLVVWNGVLVDGHHRYAICKKHGLPFQTEPIDFPDRLSAKIWIRRNQIQRRNLTDDQRAINAAFLAELEEEQSKRERASKAGMTGGRHHPKDFSLGTDVIPKLNKPTERSRSKAAKAAGVSERRVRTAQAIIRTAPKDVLDDVVAGRKTLVQAKRDMKEAKRETRREQNRAVVKDAASLQSALAVGAKFATIVADPPWDWGDEGDVNQLGRAKPDYATMNLDQLLSLPVPDFADKDCHLYLWITNRSLPKGFALIEKWGFRYITALTWVKPSFGMGNYFRGQTEHVLFAVRGSQPLKRKDVGTVFHAKRGPGGHSSKPTEFFDLVESCSPGPYLEMFSRQVRDGWTQWGEGT